VTRGPRALLAGVVALATLAVGASRELSIGRNAAGAADAAIARGDLTSAIDAAHEAAAARLPGSPYSDRGYALLADVAREAEGRGDDRTAATALRAIRAAALATRTFERMPAWARVANEGLARIAGRAPTATGNVDPTGVARETAVALGDDDAPGGGTFLAVGLLGMALVLGAAGLANRRCADRAQRTTPHPNG
jgi:hypothetical protein